jgi:hypothetical protein
MTNGTLTEELERHAKLVMPNYPSDVCSRAKLEIDRLTRDLQAARAEAAEVTRLRSYNEGLAKNVTELEAQNERLRAEKEEMRSTVADWIRMHHENGLMRTALTNIVRLDQHEKRTCIDADPSGCTYEIEMIDGPCAHIARHAVEQQLRGGVDRGNAVLKEQAAMREEDPRPAEDIIREQRDEWRR